MSFIIPIPDDPGSFMAFTDAAYEYLRTRWIAQTDTYIVVQVNRAARADPHFANVVKGRDVAWIRSYVYKELCELLCHAARDKYNPKSNAERIKAY
jgi:hypothetical protein